MWLCAFCSYLVEFKFIIKKNLKPLSSIPRACSCEIEHLNKSNNEKCMLPSYVDDISCRKSNQYIINIVGIFLNRHFEIGVMTELFC